MSERHRQHAAPVVEACTAGVVAVRWPQRFASCGEVRVKVTDGRVEEAIKALRDRLPTQVVEISNPSLRGAVAAVASEYNRRIGW